jgi:three-Cys-motif partner protein
VTRKLFTLPTGPDPRPDLLIEEGPRNKGVGRWVPEQKHVLLAKLIGGTHRARARWPHRVFVDPFCGPGRIRVEGETTTRDGGCVVAWRQSQATAPGFTSMLLGDKSQERVDACVARLSALGAPAKGFAGPADETVPQMIALVPRGALVLVYLDPYNLEYLSFDIIAALAKLPSVDFAVHFSTMDLQRNVDMELDDARARFDKAAPDWRVRLPVDSLAKASLRSAFFDYWCDLVKQLGFAFSKEMPLIADDRGIPLYRLVAFSRHDLPNRVWADVAKSQNMELGF